MDTMAQVALERGKTGEAVDLLRRAARRDSSSPAIRFHLAQALARQGEEGEARDILRSLMSETSNFPERGEAEALLERLGG
jgi:predicted Zn-dependent protease